MAFIRELVKQSQEKHTESQGIRIYRVKSNMEGREGVRERGKEGGREEGREGGKARKEGGKKENKPVNMMIYLV